MTEVVANHVDRPPCFQVAVVAGAVDQQRVQLVFELSTLEWWTSGGRRVAESLNAVGLISSEPFANGMLVAF